MQHPPDVKQCISYLALTILVFTAPWFPFTFESSFGVQLVVQTSGPHREFLPACLNVEGPGRVGYGNHSPPSIASLICPPDTWEALRWLSLTRQLSCVRPVTFFSSQYLRLILFLLPFIPFGGGNSLRQFRVSPCWSSEALPLFSDRRGARAGVGWASFACIQSPIPSTQIPPCLVPPWGPLWAVSCYL